MSQRNAFSSNYERKRNDQQEMTSIPLASHSHTPYSTNTAVHRNSRSAGHHQRRSPSPPASSYFPSLNDVDSSTMVSPEAQAHFAYSTQLRRHHNEIAALRSPADFAAVVNAKASGFWARFFSTVTGKKPERDDFANGHQLYSSLEQEKGATMSAKFAHRSIEDTIAYFRTSATNGLLRSDIPNLLATHGYNEFSVSTPEPVIIKFLKTIYESPLILLLCGSAAVSAIMGNVDDAVSITVAVLIVLTVGFVQERRSEKSLEALNKLVPHHCHVIRESETTHILANELVPGDIVKFSTGDRIPADIRLLSAIDLEIDESSLTGETCARKKDAVMCQHVPNGPHGRPGSPVALADRTCIAYMGTLVRSGRGTGIVIATGTDTEFGIIFTMMQDVEERRTPLQLNMDELAKKLSLASFAIIAMICLIGVWQHRSWLSMFTIGVSLAVAAIPEGLPIVTTVTLALGVLRMAKRKAIVKKLASVEALGSVSVICSDKTGTLTKNEQTVTEIYVVDETVQLDPTSVTPYTAHILPAMRKALDIGALCNNASTERNQDGQWDGQSTDVALLNVLDVFGVPDTRSTFQRMSEKPFNSEHKYMALSGIHTDRSSVNINGTPREMYYIKGSIDTILNRCRFYYVNDELTPSLSGNTRKAIMTKANSAASKGLRVIALAYGYGPVDARSSSSSRENSRAPSPDNYEKTNLVFVGFQAMLDPPRKGVADSVGLLQAGGIHIVMITGDAEETALAIAKKIGLRVGRTGAEMTNQYCLTGNAIDQMSKAQLKEKVGTISVFARTTPRHKMAIVEAFQSRGFVVAMTGDGVNDAPALKMADIGVSMGKSGTDVAKEAADVILVDDNFSSLLPSVEEGKSIFHNIQNFLSFQLSTAAAALTLITLSTVFGLSNPLNPMQILFINILMDGPPSQSLGVDPVDQAVMRRPPRKKDAPIITKQLLLRVLFSASMIVLGTLFVYAYVLADDDTSRRGQTMTFTCFVFLDLISAVQNRGLGCGLTQNRMLALTVSISAITQLGLVYVSFMQAVFQTEALAWGDMSVILGLAGVSMVLHEARRAYERRVMADEYMGGMDSV